MPHLKRLLVVALLAGIVGIATQPAVAQLPPSLSADARVSLVTVLPGDPVYTMFGHSAIRFMDPATATDVQFNYGTFDFDRSFPLRFAEGRLDYRLSIVPSVLAFRQYVSERRTIIEQQLALDSLSMSRLYALIVENARPENRYYRYDFFFDNCSTRIRDILEAATGEATGSKATHPLGSGPTLRGLLEPYTDRRPILGALMHTALGAGSDRVATDREHAFLPIELMRIFDESSYRGAPLVSATDTLHYAGPLPPSRKSTALWIVWPLVLACIGCSALRFSRGKPRIRVVDVALFAVAGTTGLLLCFLWFGSEHVVARENLNLLWTWPTHVVAAVVVARRNPPTWLRPYLGATVASVVILCAGLAFWTQHVPALVVPVAVLLAARAFRVLLLTAETRRVRAA